MRRFTISLALVLSLLTCVGDASPSYGTNNGFDVGGNESVCILTQFEDAQPGFPPQFVPPTENPGRDDPEDIVPDDPNRGNDPPNEDDDSVSSLLDTIRSAKDDEDEEAANAASELVRQVEEALFPNLAGPGRALSELTARVDLLSDCFDGTFVGVEALDLEPRAGMYRNQPYTFRVGLRMNITDILTTSKSSFDSEPSFTAGVMIRFVLCDALSRGFCNPVVESPMSTNSSVVLVSNASKTRVLTGGVGGGNVFSQWALPLTMEVQNSAEIIVDDLDLVFLLPRATPTGLYKFVFHSMLVLLESDGRSQSLKRVDTASSGEIPILDVQDEPEILDMSKGIEILIYLLIGIYGLFVSVVLGMLFKFRGHPAIHLAQGAFLATLLVAALVGGVFTFTFMPQNDWFCAAREPLILFPFTLIAAILVARLWRVYVTLSGAMQLGRTSATTRMSRVGASSRIGSIVDIRSWDVLKRMVRLLSFFARLPLLPAALHQDGKAPKSRPASHFRQTATGAESAQLVFFLVLPQAVLQIVNSIFYPPSLEIRFDASGTIGRYFCSREEDWMTLTGFFITAFVYVLAVMLAWAGRDLPSVFNEKDAIFHTATIAALLILINIVVVEITDNETTSPDSSVFVRCVSFLGISTLIIFNLIYPKIVRARRGETVVVGNLLRAYGNASRDDESRSSESAGSQQHGTAQYVSGEPIVLKKDEALPQSLEAQMHHMNTLFRSISDKCASGQALSKGEWDRVRRDVSKLKMDLDRVSVAWDESVDQVSEEEDGEVAIEQSIATEDKQDGEQNGERKERRLRFHDHA